MLGTSFLSMAAPRKPEDMFQEDATIPPEPELAPQEELQELPSHEADEFQDKFQYETHEAEEPQPKTPRRSFYTWTSNLPAGIPGAPTFRMHARHVMRFEEFREEVEASPAKLEICVARARQRDFGTRGPQVRFQSPA